MAKPRSLYVCNACGGDSPQWYGKCPSCGVYGSLQEQIINSSSASSVNRGVRSTAKNSDPAQARASLKFSQIRDHDQTRYLSGYGELDRVLGGGIVPGALVLIGGDPGIGKSTLLLQVAYQLAKRLARILYVSAEDSAQQIKLRASRLGVTQSTEIRNKVKKSVELEQNLDTDARLYVLPETDLDEIKIKYNAKSVKYNPVTKF